MHLTPPAHVALLDAALRPWAPADAPALARALRDSESHLRRWTPWVIDGRTPGLALEQRLALHQQAFADGTEWVYGIFAPAGAAHDGGAPLPEVLGGCGLYPRVGAGAIELGYWLATSATGRGLATRATEALVRIAFASPAIERIEIRVEPDNAASARIPARLGFRVDERATAAAGLQVWTLERGTSAA